MGLDGPFRLIIRRGDGFAYPEGADAYILYYTHHVFLCKSNMPNVNY